MDWQATDILTFKDGSTGSTPLEVRRLSPIGIGNVTKGTEDGIVYWDVEPSPDFAKRTGVHCIPLVPETRLQPITERTDAPAK